MEYSTAEIKAFIQQVVKETRSTAKVDTGFLKRSIRGNWFNGEATFREIFYGAYNGNSQLVENAKRIMPSDIPWKVIFVDEDGRETPIEGETRTGRKIRRKSVTSGNASTSNIKKFLNLLKIGKTKNDRTEGDRETND